MKKKLKLTSEQKIGIKRTINWWKTQHKQVWEISGGAGTGKTTVVHYLIDAIGLEKEQVLFMAYVGKATLALALNGNPAKTIHSSIYDLVSMPKKDENGEKILQNNREVTQLRFVKKEYLHPNIKLIVVDEGSMVNDDIAEDILSFGIPVIVLGDLNQLEPVFGSSRFLKNPDVILTEPMRQALDSPIITLSQKAIKGEKLEYGDYGEGCHVIPKSQLSDELLKSANCVICGKNATRNALNTYFRQSIYKYTRPYPYIGEKLICRKNNWRLSLDDNIFLINGLIGYVDDVYLDTYNGKSIEIKFRPEFLKNMAFDNVKIDYDYLINPSMDKRDSKFSLYNKFEYAYAITCHLSQGSQYNNVIVYDERIGNRDYYNRWLYTAITRARKQVIIAI